MTLHDFIRVHQVSITAERADSNPYMEGSAGQMDNWRCRLRAGRRSMRVYFSKGFGHGGTEPTAEEVLDCLASDAAGWEDVRSFESWCDGLGYDRDSRKAERTYHAVEHQSSALERLLGNDAYSTLLRETERE